jgi:hypothetical protein
MTALTVVYLKDTGHVLAAVTTAVPPEGSEPVKALVGAHLPWRGTGQASVDVTFPDHLLAAVTVVENLPDISRSGVPRATPLIDPQAFQVVKDPQNKTPPKVTTFPSTAIAPTAQLAFASLKLTVTLTNVPVTASLPAIVVLQEITTPAQAGTIVAPVTVTGATSGTTVATGFQTGQTWSAFAFVQGMPPAFIDEQTL